MTQKGTPHAGDIENKHLLVDVIAIPQASNTNLTGGTFGYQDGTNGFKVAPTDDSVLASRLRFIENDSNNLTISGFQDGNKGDQVVETYKTDAIVVTTMDGACTVGSYVRNSTATAGHVMALATPASPSGATPTSQNLDDVTSWMKLRLGLYLGHPGETSDVSSGGNPPTDAVDGDLVRVQCL